MDDSLQRKVHVDITFPQLCLWTWELILWFLTGNVTHRHLNLFCCYDFHVLLWDCHVPSWAILLWSSWKWLNCWGLRFLWEQLQGNIVHIRADMKFVIDNSVDRLLPSLKPGMLVGSNTLFATSNTVYLKLQWLWGGKKSVLGLLMHPGTSKFPLGVGWLNCHFKFYILPLNQLFHLNKKVLYSGMEMHLLQVALQHVDLLLTIYSFKEKIP